MTEPDVKSETGMYVCQQCGYIYNPSKGDRKGRVSPDTAFEDVPEEWTCPLCGARKSRFSPML